MGKYLGKHPGIGGRTQRRLLFRTSPARVMWLAWENKKIYFIALKRGEVKRKGRMKKDVSMKCEAG